jgi:hypothetical protein
MLGRVLGRLFLKLPIRTMKNEHPAHGMSTNLSTKIGTICKVMSTGLKSQIRTFLANLLQPDIDIKSDGGRYRRIQQ